MNKERLNDFKDDIKYYIYYKPKHVYRSIRHWIRVNGNKTHLKNVWDHMWNVFPWDYSYIYTLTRGQLVEALNYFQSGNSFSPNDKRIAEKIRLALSLIDIFTERKELWDYDHTNDKKLCKPKIYYFKVNMNNKDRFKQKLQNIDDPSKYSYSSSYYDNYPEELYKEKARRLYYRLMQEYSEEWWD